jgi:hypothetical protein
MLEITFGMMSPQNNFAWNSIIVGYTKSGDCKEALKLLFAGSNLDHFLMFLVHDQAYYISIKV